MRKVNMASPKPSPLVPGYQLDRYELLCPVAQGGMAEVWIARLRGKHGFEKLVAIKSILPQFAGDHDFQKMFLDEAHIAAGIEHQNVAQILELGEQHGLLYLVMEWIDGDALSILRRTVDKAGATIPLGVTLRILADTCGGLHAAHELSDRSGHNLGVVHRDVSPQNILVTTRGVSKLIDFGIAKARDRVGGDTTSGVLKGKVQYMAPEQALGHPIDRRADVWAIGAILYNLVAGHLPFEAETQLATLHLLTSGTPPPPLPKSVPEPIVEVVRRTLVHDPDQRMATAEDLQRAIEAAMAEARLHASTADVAACLANWVPQRAEARRTAIDLALRAAREREKMRAPLTPTSDDSAGSVTHANGGTLAEPHDSSIGSSIVERSKTPRPAPRTRLVVMGILASAAVLGSIVGALVVTRRGEPQRSGATSVEKAASKPSAEVPAVPSTTATTTTTVSTPPPSPPPVIASSKPVSTSAGGTAAKPTITTKHPPAVSATAKWKPIDKDGF
ncbi:MAG: serine/threonine-protein kinase [Polyangiales bacterium]